MSKKVILGGVVHKIPEDLKEMIMSLGVVREKWEEITPLARNEWICWIDSAKKEETRVIRINRLCEDLKKGKRRPCCWAGCMHR